MELTDVVIFLVFVVAVVSFGIFKSRHEKDSESYFLAGRGLNWWLIGFSLIAANISAEQFVGMSGAAAKDHVGLAIASYEWIAAVTLVAVAFFFLPKFLRSGIYTIPEYLEYRFDRKARTIMSLLMVAILVCVNVTCVIYLGAKALEPLFEGATLFGLKLDIAVLGWIVGVAAAVYVMIGGLKACAWTDLFWGSSLIVGGGIIMVLTFMALDNPERFEGIDPATVTQSIGLENEDASFGEKFAALKEKKMHMRLDPLNPVLPWTALLLGIWIPNLYYWGLNQYIMQRTLGARSLADGQRGVVFAAGLKLVVPFIVCIPGIIAFALFAPVLQENAQTKINQPTLVVFDDVKAEPATAGKLFKFNDDFADLYADRTEEIFTFNAGMAGIALPADADLAGIRKALIAKFGEEDKKFQEKIKTVEQFNKTRKEDEEPAKIDNSELNGMLLKIASKENPELEEQTELIGYDHDAAFPTLVARLAPTGLLGFVLAALMGAVVSTLAAILNAASTIFTMDIYKEYFNRNASQSTLVWVGRLCIPVAAVIGCLIAPMLSRPEFQGAFHFIQEFQGYISPGVLTVFLFGLFVPRSPRVCGVVGLALSPIIYGALAMIPTDLTAWTPYLLNSFLNRMGITAVVLVIVLAGITMARPLKEPVKLPEQSKIALESSSGAKLCGALIVVATAALYWIFW